MNARGPLLMVAATAGFTVMIALVKLARGWGFETMELMGWRSFASIPLLLLLSRAWRVKRWRLLAVRCLCGFSAMFFFFGATKGLGVGELSVLVKLQPLLVACIAPFALGRSERPGSDVWLALGLGLAGTIALVWPTLGETPVRFWSAMAGIASATFSAFAHTTLRAMKDENPAAIVFWFQVAVGCGCLVAIGGGGMPVHSPTLMQFCALVGIGATALFGQLLMTRAYSIDTAARIAAAGFAQPLMGFGMDAAVFRVWPSPASLLGMLLILSAAAFLFRPQPTPNSGPS